MTRRAQVYIVQCGGGGPVKIGHSFRVASRVKALQASSAFRVTLLRTIDGDARLERNFHGKFRHLRIGGEWFWLSSEMLTYEPKSTPTPIVQKRLAELAGELPPAPEAPERPREAAQ